MKRKHYDLIISWANGAKIEYLCNGIWRDAPIPNWEDNCKYRIKNERPKWQQDLIDTAQSGKIIEFNSFTYGWIESKINSQLEKYNFWDGGADNYRVKTEPDFVRYIYTHEHSGYEYFHSDTNVKLTFDGETKQLKSAEILK